MKTTLIPRAVLFTACSLLASSVLLAQDQQNAPPPTDEPQQQAPAPNGGWRRVGDPPPDRPVYSSNNQYPNDQQGPPPSGPQARQNDPPPPADYTVPPQLTIKRGTFVTVRVSQPLSSDRNQPGDPFTATLARPIVVDGVIVAQRGQTIAGRVAEAQKAGRVEGVSKLGLQLTDLTLVDGQQVPIQSQMISRSGPTSVGRDVGAVGATTATGAAIGAAVNGGVGAGVGAGAGVLVGMIGVLLTRGHPTIVYPEQVLTFRIEAPIPISTEHGAQAFRYVAPNEYDRPEPRMASGPGYYSTGPYAYGPGYYPSYPYYWGSGFGFYGPSLYFGYGRGFYGRGYYGRGYYGGFHHR